jgi:hypothetical protein
MPGYSDEVHGIWIAHAGAHSEPWLKGKVDGGLPVARVDLPRDLQPIYSTTRSEGYHLLREMLIDMGYTEEGGYARR